jgi:signal transduction histidine kinase
MFIATDGRTSLSPTEVRQIATLGEALASHVERAQLAEALRASAADAVAECQLRERFVSTLVHDLAGPLASARARAASLSGGGAGEPAAALADAIVRDLDRARAMVGALVDAHRIRAGQQLPMDIAPCCLSSLAGEAVEHLRAEHGERFVFESDPNVSGMWSADQLRRAIWNLATNAIQFGAEGAPVSVTVRRRGNDGAEIQVHNHGTAIPREVQDDLFRPFAVPRSGGTPPGGWGIGLTLVWACAEAHGGRVEVESLPGKGTTFSLVIPYDARPYADRPQPPPVASPRSGGAHRWAGRRSPRADGTIPASR